ncbi:MAG: DnaJ domain-containing protein [Candidatus Thermoplasmatota archaeon]|nr:DnaJ domain-containing protein [Candidatus Thermoplasmatota archaeon]
MTRGKLSDICYLSMVLIILLSVCLIGVDHANAGDEGEIIVMFDENWMSQELPGDGVVDEPLPIHWHARHTLDEELLIDLLFQVPGTSGWESMVMGLENSGTWIWYMEDPFIPNGEGYRLKVVAYTSSYRSAENISSFTLNIFNPCSPSVKLLSTLDDVEISGDVLLRWGVIDEDTPDHLIGINIFISYIGGGNYSLIYGNVENLGECYLRTEEHPNSRYCRLKIIATDEGMRTGEVQSPLFSIFNNHPPEASLLRPEGGRTLRGSINISWISEDLEDGEADLRVSLYYRPIGSSSWVVIMELAPNRGFYIWNTSDVQPSGDGLLLRLEVYDRQGLCSPVEVIRFWVYTDETDILVDIRYPVSSVRDRITIEWDYNNAFLQLSEELILTIRHRIEGTVWGDIYNGMATEKNMSMEFTLEDDGIHYFQLEVRDRSDASIHDIKEIGPITVYHEEPPMMHVRAAPPEDTIIHGNLRFNLSGFDRNGEQVHFIGYYRVQGDSWIEFDRCPGGIKVVLEWDTSSLPPGRYEVRLIVYDRSIYNLSTSTIKGPYFIGSDTSAGVYIFDDDQGTEGRSWSGTVLLAIILVLMIAIIGMAGRAMYRRRKRLVHGDLDLIPMDRKMIQVYLKMLRPEGDLDRLLPAYNGFLGSTFDISSCSKGNVIEREEDLDRIIDMAGNFDLGEITDEDLRSYSVLGVPSNASSDTIRSTYISFVKKFHPDRFHNSDPHLYNMAAEQIRMKNRARSALLDPARRALIDRRLRDEEGSIIRNSSLKTMDELKNLRR